MIDVNKISDDVVYTYDYWIKADTLNISGKSYHVKEITANSLILGWGQVGEQSECIEPDHIVVE